MLQLETIYYDPWVFSDLGEEGGHLPSQPDPSTLLN